jgi:hypothetical protein
VVAEAKVTVSNQLAKKPIVEADVANLMKAFDCTFYFIQRDLEYFSELGFTESIFDRINDIGDEYKIQVKELNAGYTFQDYDKIYDVLKDDSYLWFSTLDGQTCVSID